MSRESADAVVVGGGPNGLVAAIALADAGWDVVLLEANDEVGGAVRSGEVTAPGFVTDLYSAFYPLAAASPVIRDLGLEAHGLQWRRAPAVVAHALDDGQCAVLHDAPQDTAASVESFGSGDGATWLRMFEEWRRLRDPFLDALFTPFPPMRSASRLLRRVGVSGGLDLSRLALTPVRRLGEELFAGQGGPLLLTGNALHSDLSPDAAGSGLFGWLLAMLAQDVGFPVPAGGAGRLAGALRSRAQAAGADIRCGARVGSIHVSHGRAVGVRLVDGTAIQARRAVLADVAAPALYEQLVGLGQLPSRFAADVRRFQWDNATLKLNWALERPIPWLNDAVCGAGTVHLGVDNDGLVEYAADLTLRRMPRRPFLLLGQMTTADPSRSPEGTESAWAYTHVPQGASPGAMADQVERMEKAVERAAPGFRAGQVARYIQTPGRIESANHNLVGGATNSGTAALHQQLVFRPARGLGRPETPLPGLYLASASAHPGGGVHGACGWNAAQSALRAHGRLGGVQRALVRTAWGRLLRER